MIKIKDHLVQDKNTNLGRPSILHTTAALFVSKSSSQTVPHLPLWNTSTRPSELVAPPLNLTVVFCLAGAEQERQIVARYARLTPSCKAGACTGQNSSMKNNKGH